MGRLLDVTRQTSLAPGRKEMSACAPRPIQSFGTLPLPDALAAHFPSVHLSLSQSSSESHSSPSGFLPAHLPPEQVPLLHSVSDEHSSPVAFFSTHFSSEQEPL